MTGKTEDIKNDAKFGAAVGGPLGALLGAGLGIGAIEVGNGIGQLVGAAVGLASTFTSHWGGKSPVMRFSPDTLLNIEVMTKFTAGGLAIGLATGAVIAPVVSHLHRLFSQPNKANAAPVKNEKVDDVKVVDKADEYYSLSMAAWR